MIGNVVKPSIRNLLPDVLCCDTASSARQARNIVRYLIHNDERRYWLENTSAFAQQAPTVI